MRVAVLGLGEAGSIYATDLVARGAVVVGADPIAPATPAGVTRVPTIADAVRGADVVLSLVGGRAAASVLGEAVAAMDGDGVFADMNTGGPAEKRALAAQAAAAGVPFADVAILAPVPRGRADTPLLVSGSGAERAKVLFDGLRLPATVVGTEAGVAGGLKLLRSVFMKGLAALVFESVEAAGVVGAEEWVVDQIASELGPDGHALVQRLLEGTPVHAVRREAEMRDAQAFLASLDAAHPMTDATITWLHAIAERRDAAALGR